MLKIPNVRIVVPRIHSTTHFRPRIFLPLYQKAWNPLLPDPERGVYAEAIPKGRFHDTFRYMLVDSVNELTQTAVREFSGMERNDGQPIFESVYGHEGWRKAVADMLAEYCIDPDVDAEDTTEDVSDSVSSMRVANLPITYIKGIAAKRADDLTGNLGIRTVGELLAFTVAQISEACEVSESRAQRWCKQANTMIAEERGAEDDVME